MVGPIGSTGLRGETGPANGIIGSTGPPGPPGTIGTLLNDNNTFSGSNAFSVIQRFSRINMAGTIIQLNGDDFHSLQFSNADNGFKLLGYNGGLLGSQSFPAMIQLTASTINFYRPSTFLASVAIGAPGTMCSGMQFGSFVGLSNATQTVTFTSPFTGGIIPKVILTVVNAGQTYPTGNAFVVSESLTGFTYNFSYVQSNQFVHAASGVKINWMALQG